MDDATVKLLLETGESTTAVKELRDELEQLRTKLVEYADAILRGETPTQEQIDQHKEVSARLQEVRGDLQQLVDQEERYKAVLAESVAAIDAQTAAQERMRDVCGDLNESVESTLGTPGSTEPSDSGGGGAGLKGMATSAVKAEKAIASLASGHGLGRLGSMLEGVMGPMGVPGLGMALGALAYAIEPQIPKIKAWFDEWDMGAKKITAVNEALAAFAHASTTGQTSRKKRQLGKLDSKIAALEDKEDEQGWLSDFDKADLHKLREASSQGHINLEFEQQEEQHAEEARKRQAELDDIAADAEIEANDPEQQMMLRRHAKRAEHNRQAEIQKEHDAKLKRVTTSLDKRTNADVAAELDAERLADHEAKQAAATAKAAATKAAAAARRQAHENTPEAMNRRQQQAEHNQWLQATNQMTYGFGANQQAQIARMAQQQYEAGQQFGMTVEQAMARGVHQFQMGMMKRLQTGSESYLQ